jgi:hypothetical protein
MGGKGNMLERGKLVLKLNVLLGRGKLHQVRKKPAM